MVRGRRSAALLLVASLCACAPPLPPASREGDAPSDFSSTATPDPRVPSPTLFDDSWTDRSTYALGLTTGGMAALSDLAGATVYHAVLELSEDGLALEGAEEVYYVNREASDLAEVDIALYPEYMGGATEILAARVNGSPSSSPLESDGALLRVPLEPALTPGSPVVISLDFRVTVPEGPGAGYGLLGAAGGVLSLSHILPMVAVYDEQGWEISPPAPHGDLVFSDAAFFLVRLAAPARLTLVSSGVEIGRREDDNRQEITYASGPARDFFLAAGERFTAQSRIVGQVTLRSYTLPELEETSSTALQVAADALGVFESILGDYPYRELDIATTGLQALGMEYPGAFALAFPLYDPADESYPPVVLEATLVHELAHQWFFNVVGNDPLHEPWLDESLAQYATLAYFEETHGADGARGFREALQDRWQRVGGAEIPIGMPATAYTTQEYGAIIYGRGALFVEELRNAMGRPAFDAFLLGYVEANRWGIASTAGFRALAEEYCRCDLGGLFEDWVYPR